MELCNFQDVKAIKKLCAFSSLADKKPTSKKILLEYFSMLKRQIRVDEENIAKKFSPI